MLRIPGAHECRLGCAGEHRLANFGNVRIGGRLAVSRSLHHRSDTQSVVTVTCPCRPGRVPAITHRRTTVTHGAPGWGRETRTVANSSQRSCRTIVSWPVAPHCAPREVAVT